MTLTIGAVAKRAEVGIQTLRYYERHGLLSRALSLTHSAWWLAFTAFVGVAMVWFAATGYCIMANGLYWLGAEPRLAPDRAPACAGPEGDTVGAL